MAIRPIVGADGDPPDRRGGRRLPRKAGVRLGDEEIDRIYRIFQV